MNRTLALPFRHILVAIIITLSCVTLIGAQERDRLVDWQQVIPGSDATVLEIVDITINGKSVTPGHPFTAGEDWLDTLKFRVRNVSGKTINAFAFGIAFPEIGLTGGSTAALSIPYNIRLKRNNSDEEKPILADEEVNVKLPPDQLGMLRQVSIQRIGTTHLTRVNILPGLVHFADGSGLGGISLRRPKQ